MFLQGQPALRDSTDVLGVLGVRGSITAPDIAPSVYE